MGETTRDGGVQFDELRDRLRIEMNARGMLVARVARSAGIGELTLSAWINGKYQGDYAAVAVKIETWLRSRQDEASVRASAFALPPFVVTPTAAAIIEVLGHAQFAPDIVTITGVPGVGKTTAAREYQRTRPNVYLWTGEPAAASTHAMLEGICDAIGVAENATSRRSRAIVRKLASSQGLLIVDEAQHLNTQALDQLRTLHDKAAVGIALMGNFDIYMRIAGGGRRGQMAQMESRIGMRLARLGPLARDVDALLDAADVTGAQERKLLRAAASRPGALRIMVKVLRVAHMLAAADTAEQVADRHIVEASQRLSDKPNLAEAA